MHWACAAWSRASTAPGCCVHRFEALRRTSILWVRRCEELGLIVRPLVNMCVFSPPLIITEAQIDEMFDILEQAIRDVALTVDR